MKLQLYFLIIITLLISSCNRKNKAVINGFLKSVAVGEKVYIEELRLPKNVIIDSANVRSSGKFRNRIELQDPGFYQLVFMSGPSILLILSPGEEVRISADMENFYDSKCIEGSPNSIRVNMLHDSLRATIKLLNEVSYAYSQIQENNSISQNEKEMLEKKYLEIKKNYHRYSTAFILEGLKELSNIAALYQEYTTDDFVFNSQKDIQFFKLVSDSLSKYYPEVRYVKTLRDNYQVIINDYNLKKLLRSTEPVTYNIPDILLPGLSGKNIALSSLKGKLVLLSFWSVTQPESLENMLELKRVYSKYHSYGFEIFQVSVTNSMETWKKVVKFEEIPWKSVCDTTYPNSLTRYLFNVNSLPMNYLLDREQEEILAKNVSPDVLERSLPHLLNR